MWYSIYQGKDMIWVSVRLVRFILSTEFDGLDEGRAYRAIEGMVDIKTYMA